MEQDELLRRVVGVLERLDLPYLVTGSIATVFYGEPRFTHDIDVVLELPLGRVEELIAAFPTGEFYLDGAMARDAVLRRGQFNVLHPASGLKVDFILATDEPFNRSRFARRVRIQPDADYGAFFSSAEDLVIRKLEFHRRGGSEKHLRDIAGVLRVSGDLLDYDYIESWAHCLGLEETWHRLRERMARQEPAEGQ